MQQPKMLSFKPSGLAIGTSFSTYTVSSFTSTRFFRNMKKNRLLSQSFSQPFFSLSEIKAFFSITLKNVIPVRY